MSAKFFVGIEVEHTVQYGKITLFVNGIQPIDQIVKHAMEQGVNHIYLGASQSFKINDTAEWIAWDHMVKSLLAYDYYVTVDFDVKYAEQTLEYNWHTYSNYIPMISVKLPQALKYGNNATLKIDDDFTKPTNSGVWCNQLSSLCADEIKTSWHMYTDDIILE
jgi:hypothetical protein